MQREKELIQGAWVNLRTGEKPLAGRYAERALLSVDDFETKVMGLNV